MTTNEHKTKILNDIKDFFKEYPDLMLEISSHDGGSVSMLASDVEFDEIEVETFENYEV